MVDSIEWAQQKREVKIVDIRRGVGKREKFVYAHLVDAESGETLVSSTLDYIVRRYAADEHFQIVNVVEILEQVMTLL